MIAVDTNVFVYALDDDTPIKQAKAHQLLEGLAKAAGSTVLLWQVAGEVLNNLRKSESAGLISPERVETHFRTFSAMFPLIIPTSGVLATYFNLRSQFSL